MSVGDPFEYNFEKTNKKNPPEIFCLEIRQGKKSHLRLSVFQLLFSVKPQHF